MPFSVRATLPISAPLGPDEDVWSNTQFKRAIAGAYRNSITKQVSDRLHDVIIGWLSPTDRARPHLALSLDPSNYNKWLSQGNLTLRVLTQMLVQHAKDFTDLYLPKRVKILGPDRAEDLKRVGSRAALMEGYKRLHSADVELSDNETLILLLLYRYKEQHGLPEMTHSRVVEPSAGDSREERSIAKWILANLDAKQLKALVEKWSYVCVQVCRVLEEHTGLD